MQIEPDSAPTRASDDGVLPLINLVFLLLVFFMVAGQLKQPAPFAIETPTTSADNKATVHAKDTMRISVSADGDLALNGIEISRRELRRTLRQAKPSMVTLRADAAITAGEFQKVIATLKQAGIERVLLGVQPGHAN
ncbi:MAG TPA: biopolymer transporter ExbD [Gammaproteobacteria bacterium]|nr:biopolymer transporter ExbD [Gammaproteobacteria bacterium]